MLLLQTFYLSLDPDLVLVEAAIKGLACPRCDNGALVSASTDSGHPMGEGQTTDDYFICCSCLVKLSAMEDLSYQLKVHSTILLNVFCCSVLVILLSVCR